MKKILNSLSVFLLTGIAAMFFAVPLHSQTADEYFILGNNAYSSGDFVRAKENYKNAEKQKQSAEISYNIANTCVKLGQKGEALLNYMRALYKNPRMREAAANLQMLAKDNSIDLPDNIFTLQFFSELSSSEWASIAFVSFWVFVLLAIVPSLYGARGMATIFMAILMFAFFIFAVLAVRDWNSYANLAVSTGDDVKVKVSPVNEAPVASIVQEGQIAKIEKSKGKFLKIRTKSGKIGWVDKSEMVPLVYFQE